MVNTALYILFGVSAAAAVQVGFAPAASSYIYRNDHNGPASLIQLGPAYKQADLYAAPLAQPLKAFEAYDLAPVPLPYIAAKPIAVEDEDDDDDDDEESDEYTDGGDLTGLGHGHGYEKGAGSDYGEEHHSAHGNKGGKGYKSEGHHAKGESGHYGKDHNEGYYNEDEGGKKKHHNEASAHGKHYEAGESYKGGDHGNKEHFSKGEDVSGYHKIFNKNEFKKDHDFYDVADKGGHFKKHGYGKAYHGSEEGDHKKGGHHDSAFNKGDFGKAGFNEKGYVDDSDHGHSAEEGHDSHYENDEGYGKKGGSGYEKAYGYADDDEDDKE